MAAEARAKTAAGDARQFLTFTLGEEEYGVDIMRVHEVKGWTETTRLPNTPGYMRGVLNLRGSVIPIFDLRARFTGELTPADGKHVIIVLAIGERIAGILADTVSDILTAAAEEIKPAPSDDDGADKSFVTGLIAGRDRMVVLLDIGKLLHGAPDGAERARSPAA